MHGRPQLRTVLQATGALLLAGSLACCDRSGDERQPNPAQAVAGPPTVSVPTLRANSEEAAETLPNEPCWRAAAEGDPMDLEQLAGQEGAIGLVRAVSRGGLTGTTALAALPFTRDRRLALRPLCRWVEHAPAFERGLLLSAIYDISVQPEVIYEQLDVAGVRACRRSMLELQMQDLTPMEADQVSGILNRLPP